MPGFSRTLTRFAFAAAFLVLLASSPSLAGDCASAEIGESFVLPDGSVHEAGMLTLCFRQDYSPVSTLHTTYVDQMPVGMFSSTRTEAAALENEPNDDETPNDYFMLFDRRPGSPLRLAGYGLSTSGAVETFILDRPAHVEVEDSIALILVSADLGRI